MIIDFAARAKGRAMYLCAGQSAAHNLPMKTAASLRPSGFPSGLSGPADLDFLDSNCSLFLYNRALFSAGQFLGRSNPASIPRGMFSRRPGNTILTDSGGLQFARNKAIWQGMTSQQWSLDFAEANGDEAIGLDIPTLAVGSHPIFSTFQACLSTTLDNNRYWLRHRRGGTRFLAVLQGRDRKEARAWLDAAKAVPMDGWAFGGGMRANHRWLAEALLDLHAAGLLGRDRNRIHVLGDSSLKQAVMLSALQRSMRHITGDDELLITFDTASPSENASWGKAYGHPRLSPTSFAMGEFKPPASHGNAGHVTPFPILSSALAHRLTVDDLIAPASTRQHGWDSFGAELVTHHNVEALLRGIDQANSVMELPRGWKDDQAPPEVIRAYEALDTMWRYPRDPMGHLAQNAKDFAKL